MPKLVGIMCVRDEADLLPQVLPHVRSKVDHIYAYDDGSQDGTWELIKSTTDYAIRREDDKERMKHNRGNYHHLLERIKKDFKGEDVWVIITMGDRFFLNKTPREIVDGAGGFDCVEGVQLDFLRHRIDPWTKDNDPFPDMTNIRSICRWAKFDELCIVAYKLSASLTYEGAKYPWPRGLQNKQFSPRAMNNKISLEMPFLEHQGRRTPKHCVWKYSQGSRPMSVRANKQCDVSSFEAVMENLGRFYTPYKVFPWKNNSTLKKIIEVNNQNYDKPNLRHFYWGLECAAQLFPLPPREDHHVLR